MFSNPAIATLAGAPGPLVFTVVEAIEEFYLLIRGFVTLVGAPGFPVFTVQSHSKDPAVAMAGFVTPAVAVGLRVFTLADILVEFRCSYNRNRRTWVRGGITGGRHRRAVRGMCVYWNDPLDLWASVKLQRVTTS